MNGKKPLFPKGLSKEEYNARRQAYLKEWRKNRPGWNRAYSLNHYHRNKDEINKRRKLRRDQLKQHPPQLVRAC